MIHEDGRMDVIIDGETTTRPAEYDYTHNSLFGDRNLYNFGYAPKTFDGERVAYVIGSDVPIIFRTKL